LGGWEFSKATVSPLGKERDLSEEEYPFLSVFTCLKRLEVKGVDLVVLDDHKGLSRYNPLSGSELAVVPDKFYP